jgi:transcriptional regulator with XRE-family HTH domain
MSKELSEEWFYKEAKLAQLMSEMVKTRKKSNVTQKELGEKLYSSRCTVNRFECVQHGNIRKYLDYLYVLGYTLNITIVPIAEKNQLKSVSSPNRHSIEPLPDP